MFALSSSSSAWFFQKGYAQGVFWIILVSLISNMNDILMRLTGQRLDPMQISFFRFFFSTITLIPIMISEGKSAFKTQRPGLHVLRAILGFGAVAFWCYGVSTSPLALASTMAQTVPLFVLPMAALFLKESVGWQRTLATLTGFAGILVILMPSGTLETLMNINPQNLGIMALLAAAILFAVSDILNKVMVETESSYTMLFYFALGTTIVSFGPALLVWKAPTMNELIYLVALGGGANLILYCLLKAFAATDVSALAPYRYVEMLSAGVFGYTLFQEIPDIFTLLGAALIVPSTFAIAYYETKIANKGKDQKPVTETDKTKAA